MKLKPCPFCGGEARFYRDSVLNNFRHCDVVFVRCMECGARTKNVFYDALVHMDDGEYKDAAKAWNRREPLEDIVEQLEEMADTADQYQVKSFASDEINYYNGLEKGFIKAIGIVKGGCNE